MLDSLYARNKLLIELSLPIFKALGATGRHPGRKVELGFTLDRKSSATRKLLDFGSAGSVFLLKMARINLKLLQLTVGLTAKHISISNSLGRTLRYPFSDESLVLLYVSTIEHLDYPSRDLHVVTAEISS